MRSEIYYVRCMKRIASYILAVSLVPTLALAQDDADQGTSLMERGAQLFVEGLLREMEPALDELSGLADEIGPALKEFTKEMGPALAEIIEQVEDWSAYHPPEILPNGDIIIRRKSDHPKKQSKPDDHIEL